VVSLQAAACRHKYNVLSNPMCGGRKAYWLKYSVSDRELVSDRALASGRHRTTFRNMATMQASCLSRTWVLLRFLYVWSSFITNLHCHRQHTSPSFPNPLPGWGALMPASVAGQLVGANTPRERGLVNLSLPHQHRQFPLLRRGMLQMQLTPTGALAPPLSPSGLGNSPAAAGPPSQPAPAPPSQAAGDYRPRGPSICPAHRSHIHTLAPECRHCAA
jgi:hypothetical protein